MKEKRMFSGLLAAVMLLGTAPYSVLADEITPVSVTKSGNTISVTGSNVSAENIKLYDNKAELLNFTAADDDGDGVYTVDISDLVQSPEERYVKVGDEYYSFYKPYEVNNDLATWKQIYPLCFANTYVTKGETGSSVINSTSDVKVNEDGSLTKETLATNNSGYQAQSVLIPSKDYEKYKLSDTTVKIRVTTAASGDGDKGGVPLVGLNIQDITRPAEELWENSQWTLSGKGYSLYVSYGNLGIIRMDNDLVNTKSNTTFNRGSTQWQGGNFKRNKIYDIEINSKIVNGELKIHIVSREIENGVPAEKANLDTTYTDQNPVSTSGSVCINMWNSVENSIIHSVEFTDNGKDVVTKCADITKISQKITSVTKDWDELTVTFDDNIGAFAKEAITVTNAQGTKENIDVTISKNTAVVDLTNVEGSDEAYKLSVKTDGGVKEYSFNKTKAFFEDFNDTTSKVMKKEDCGAVKEAKNPETDVFSELRTDAGETAVVPENGKYKVANRDLFTNCKFSELKSSDNAWVKFKTQNTQTSKSTWDTVPAVMVNISNAYRDASWTEFWTGYAIFRRQGNMVIQRMDRERLSPAGKSINYMKKVEGTASDIYVTDEFEVEVKTQMKDGKFVAWAKITLSDGKYNIYTYEDENPVSTYGKTFCSSSIHMTASEDNVRTVTVDDLMMTSTDNTVTYIKTKDDYMADWAEQRVAETGRNEINFVTLGGSITQGGGWTDVVRAYFEEKMGKTVNLINAGIGGTGSSFATMRLYEDVISKKPDIVFMDHAVNDISLLNLNHGNVPKTATYVERIIRELKSLENPPMIFMVDFTTEDILKLDKRIDKNYEDAKAEFNKNSLVTDKFGNKVTKEEDLHIMKKAYNGTDKDNSNNSAYYTSAIPEDYYNWVAEYYDIPNININDFWKNFVSLDPLTTDDINDENREDYGNKGYGLTVDYEKMLAAYKEFATGTNYADLQAAIGDKTDVTPILSDRVHCSAIGKKMYGDFMVNEFKNNASVSFEAQKMPEKPLLSSSYEKTGDIKDVVVTKAEIENNKRFEINGLTVEDGSAAGTYLKNGVKLTAGENGGTFTFKFYGNSFGYYGSGNVTAKMDGSAYRGEYHTINPLVAKEHTFTLTVPANKTYELYRIFVDEESFNGLGSAKLGDNSFVTIDLTGYADARAYKSVSREKDKNMAWQSTQLLKWQDRINHTNTVEESIGYSFIEEDTFVAGLTDGKYSTENAIYDMSSVVNGTRYKAISNNSQKTIATGNVKTDKVYSLVARAAGGKDDTVAKVVLNYADGKTEVVTSELKETAKVDSLGQSANSNKSASGIQIYECVFEADDTKELESVQLVLDANDTDKNYKIIVLGMSLKPAANEKLAVAFDEFTDKDGKAINESISALMGKEIVYKAKVVNATAKEIKCDAIVALFNGDTLVTTEVTPTTISATGEVKANITLPTAEEDGNYTVKVFVWNGLGTLVPVMDTTVVAQ